MKCLVLVTHFDIFCIQLSIALFLFPLHRLNHLRQLTNTHPWIARSIGITSPASTLSTSFFSHPLAATMAKDLQAFRAHPPLWEDGHQTDERPNEKSRPIPSRHANMISPGHSLHSRTRSKMSAVSASSSASSSASTSPSFSCPIKLPSIRFIEQRLFILKYFGGTILVTIDSSIVRVLGLVISLGGQIIRSLAMITAANSFNHRVSTHSKKQDDHTLVTNGIYQFSRHPSYFGFFWWSIGIQLFLANPFSLAIFSFVLWSFFNSRIQNEELHLVKFFGKAYITYRSTIPTRIPFIK
ncbi:hypothetical protein KEM48_011835 [Puccinia striiformis f. sp. tritici PST-130]|nr:hypothetical protein KEM48_011835 [Puccinia striiformis f. sp. tritici PST-130]